MKIKQHPNFYHALKAMGAGIIEPLKLDEDELSGKHRRLWRSSCTMVYNAFTIKLTGRYLAPLTPNMEAAAANLNIDSLETPDGKVYTRVGMQILMLECGLYCADGEFTKKQQAGARKIVDYDALRYVGIPTTEELDKLHDLGYRRFIGWEI